MLFRPYGPDKRFSRAGEFYLCLPAPLCGLLGEVYAIYVLLPPPRCFLGPERPI